MVSEIEGDAHRMRRIAILLEYDGTAYRGSQYQENGPSIQAALEGAIASLTGAASRASFAGRTDAGVHALGQVATFDTASRLTGHELRRGLEHYLPADIGVRAVREAPDRFDPRRDAVSRTYRYRILNRRGRPAVERNRAWQVVRTLDVRRMREAATVLEGKHDFAAFAGPYEGLTLRTLRRCEVTARCEHIAVELEAEAFLPQQVRRTVGTLVEVGLGRVAAEQVEELRDRAEPGSAQPVAPPCGLYLMRVTYDGLDFGPSSEDGQDE
jgi:tRNA pseudouridine38-40 synthase